MEADIALLDDARKMNGDALAKIFDLYAPAVFKYALGLCGDPLLADQVVGDVFAKLLDHLSTGDGPVTNLRSYLYQTAYHLIVDDARYWHRRVALEVVDFFVCEEDTTDKSLQNRSLFETISQVIERDLTDYQRHVIILRFVEEFSLRETAEILGKSVNVIKATQNRACVILRKALDYQAIKTGGIFPVSANYSIA